MSASLDAAGTGDAGRGPGASGATTDSSKLPDSTFVRFVRSAGRPLAMPLAVLPGAHLIGRPVGDLTRDGAAQARASEALRSRLGLPFALAAMDLSVEAEAFGAEVRFSQAEVPTVVGRRVTDAEGVAALGVPPVGAARSGVALDAIRQLRAQASAPLVIASCIGPLSLAGRLFGVSELLEESLLEPQIVHALVEKATVFLAAFTAALRDAGADAVLMAEPTAGLLSPGGILQFSSPYIRRIRQGVERAGFSVLVHNCGARHAHLTAILDSGAPALHFGAPMDLPAACTDAPKAVVLCGNLDPARVFLGLAPEAVADATRALVAAVGDRRDIVFSSGCDIPSSTPVESLVAFVRAVESGD